jgi:branched-chain amino acid transport system ATP-binding protein
MIPLFEVDALSHAFGGIRVADSIGLTVQYGDRVALIGPNGAGKTSFVDMVCGRLRPQRGRIWLEGRDITRLSDVKRVQAGIVRSFQITRLFPQMTVRQHLGLALLASRKKLNNGFTDVSQDKQLDAEVIASCATVGLQEAIDRTVSQLAYGAQRMLEIALALALKPKLLILDEPAAGVAQAEMPRILDLLERLPGGLAVLMIEHDMDLVFRFARRVVVLAAGRVISDGSPREIAADPNVRRAYLGDDGERR